MEDGPELSRILVDKRSESAGSRSTVDNVSDEVNEWVKDIAEKVASGEIEVEKNLSEIDVEGEALE